MTTGQKMATTLCEYFSISKRTPRIRKGENMLLRIMQAVLNAATLPGYYAQSQQEAMQVGFHAVHAYDKHVCNYRLPGEQIMVMNQMSPYQFILLLAQMVDDGVSNSGEAEEWFRCFFAANAQKEMV